MMSRVSGQGSEVRLPRTDYILAIDKFVNSRQSEN